MNEIVYVGQHSLTFSVSRHTHKTLELVYCTGGRGRFMFDALTLPYEEGDIVIIPPHIPHSNAGEDGFTNIHEPALNLKTPAIVRDDNNRFIRNAFSAVFSHFSSPARRNSALLNAYGNLLLCYISAYQDSPGRSKVVEEIENTIIWNFANPNFELDAYLRSLSFNYDYLRRLFKKEAGMTPHQYLMDTRLTAAADNLSLHHYGNNISEVSYLCGFREPLYFSRMFKKKFGISPSHYLKNHARNEEDRYLNPDNVKIMLDDADA